MRNLTSQPSHLFAVLLSSLVLSGCGAGSSTPELAPAAAPAALPAPLTAPASEGAPVGASAMIDPPLSDLPSSLVETGSSAAVPERQPRAPGPALPPSPQTLPDPSALTYVTLENTGAAQSNVPVTFGHVFAPGHISAAHTVVAALPDGSAVPMQVDVKAKHADGSLRHAVLTAKVASLAAGQSLSLSLKAAPAAGSYAPVAPTALLADGFTAAVNITLGGVRYTASADTLLRSGSYQTWLSGPQVNEWLVSAPLKTDQGASHPHLTARFAIRAVNGVKQARVDVTLENAWAYEPNPQNFVYDTQVLVGGLPVYTKVGMTHYHHARWRKMFWWGAQPSVHVKHNAAYLIASRALPNYDRSFTVPETSLASMKSNWTGAKIEPMGTGAAMSVMPTTGGRPDIGLLPGWAATYLMSMDKRAKEVTMGTADLAGSWSTHYRNKTTGRPVTLQEFPYMTILGNPGDTVNPATGKREAFPLCATTTSCTTPNKHDSSHQPGFAYLPYLVSGDHFYLEELQFWAMWNAFSSNPHYRQFGKGLVAPDQVRGQAWSMRTLAEAAYITPDSDPLKAQFSTLVGHNLDWYNAQYSNNASANVLGALVNSAVVYSGGTAVAPWQDDFFTAAVGHAMELGFDKAKPLLSYKTRFPVLRMSGAGSCWIDGAMYSLVIRSTPTSPYFTDIGTAAVATHTATFTSLPCASQAMATFLKLRVGEMTGYSSEVAGYPSNMQPALAFAVDVGGVAGMNAWNIFAARTVKPNYGLGPQFSIVPRTLAP